MTAAQVDPWAVDYPQRIALATSLLDTHHCPTPACARVIQQTRAILTDTPTSSSIPAPRRERIGAVPGTAPTAPERLATSDVTGGPTPMIVQHPAPVQTEARHTTTEAADIIQRLQHLLSEAIRQREHLIRANIAMYRQTHHWYVDDPEAPGYCAACALPAVAPRHVERAA